MITIPTTELIGCISAVLPIFTSPPKDNPLAGIAVQWNGEELTWTTYDVWSGACVTWVPGEGAEGTSDEDDSDDIRWGGDDSPWRIFISYADAKEIVKLFSLPAKLWRHPVNLKVNSIGTKLIIERNDSIRGERWLTVGTDNDMLKKIPNIRERVERIVTGLGRAENVVAFNGARLASLGASISYGVLSLTLGGPDEPVAVRAGGRYRAFVYEAGVKPTPYNFLRDATGVHTS